MDPAFQGKTSKNNEDEPTDGTVQGSPGQRGEDRIGHEGFIKSRAGGGIGQGHVLEWYAGKRLLWHVVGKDEL
jgi:hypothetical protein